MRLDLAPDAHALELGADPLMLIRPVGEWDVLGPIDRAQMVLNRNRRDQVDHIRRLRA